MPNAIAYIALLAWPIVALWLFKKRPPLDAVFIILLGGLLLLPVRTIINLPVLDLEKSTISALMAFFGCIFIAKQRLTIVPRMGPEKWFVLVYLFQPILTVITNQDAYGISNGLTPYDAFTSIVARGVNVIPFMLGLQLVKTKADQILIFKFLVIAAVMYTLPILWEIRMSPQLHAKLYGFFPHDFAQQMRGGGFRAVVFLGHGLYVATFLTISLAAAVMLWKNKVKLYGFSALWAVVYLLIILVMSKSLGPLVLGILLLVIIGFMSSGVIRNSSMALASIVMLYPLLCTLDLFPHEALVDYIHAHFGAERAQSLEFRFMNEALFIEHAKEKVWFGWGGWGRFFVPGAIVDGAWIARFGTSGIVGFISYFGLIFWCVLRAIKASRRALDGSTVKLVLGHAALVAVIMIDQIPNSSIGGMALLLWFIIGALLGRANNIIQEQQVAHPRDLMFGRV